MNREIKFRIWDQRNKEMVHHGLQERNVKDFVLMQYTGLKDINGKEIYEGDLVRICGCELISKVFWHKQGLCFSIKVGQLSDYTNVEIIGNIFANPELLKKEKL